MRHAASAIEKWRYRAIFIDLQRTRVTFFNEGEGRRQHRKVPQSFLKKPVSNIKHTEKVAMRRLSIVELLSGIFTIFCFVVFVYIKMFSLEIKSQEAVFQLETYAAVSLLIGMTFFVTLMTSVIFRRLFPGEMQ
jgi:hypothetical protein